MFRRLRRHLSLLQAFIICRAFEIERRGHPVFVEKFNSCGLNSFLQLGLGIVRYPRAEPSFETLDRWEKPDIAGHVGFVQQATWRTKMIVCY